MDLGPHWKPFEPYVQAFVERIEHQWQRILIESRTAPKSGTKVVVAFTLNAAGRVTSIVRVEGTAEHGAMTAAVNAVTSAAPFGEWTPEMVAALGESQELTFTFDYQ